MGFRSLMLCGAALLMLAGCGGEDDGDDAREQGAGSESTAAAGPAPKLGAVLACMKREGLDARDQSSSTGPKIGVDYPAGRLIVSFEESAEAATLTTSVAKTQDPSGSAVQKGTVVIITPADPAAEVGRPIAERCVDSP